MLSTANLAAPQRNVKIGSRKIMRTYMRNFTLKVFNLSLVFEETNTSNSGHLFITRYHDYFLEHMLTYLDLLEAVAAVLSTLSVDAQKRAAKDSQKKEAKAAAAEAKAAETKAQAQVLIKRVERNKRKYVTAVSGLEAHGMDLKKVAKEWGKKFATGSSVTKTPSGGEEVVVQGDNSDEIFDWVVDVAGVPEANVDCIEDKKKKGT